MEFVNVTLYDKRDFADMIKLRILKSGDYPDYLGGHNVVARVLIRKCQEL